MKIRTICLFLALFICLSVFCSALAAPTPSPTGGLGSAKSTPTPDGFTLPDPNGDGGGDPGGGDEGPDGPGTDGQENPTDQPPPEQNNPGEQGEKPDNTPTEVDPADVGQKPFKPKKAKVKKLVGTYTITAKGYKEGPGDNIIKHDYTLELTAKNPTAGLLGKYNVSGTLKSLDDTAHYMSIQRDNHLVTIEFELSGPLNGTFTLEKPEDYEELAPLVPRSKPDEVYAPLTKARAKGSGNLRWDYRPTKNNVIDQEGNRVNWMDDIGQSLVSVGAEVEVFDGFVIVELIVGNDEIQFFGQVAKSVKWVDE